MRRVAWVVLAAQLWQLAYSAFQRGNGALTTIALDQVLEANPAHRLSELLRIAMTIGQPPCRMRDVAERATATATRPTVVSHERQRQLDTRRSPLPGADPTRPAEITLVTAAIGIRLTDAGPIGDRLVLRSASDGLPDAYAVFERVGGATSRWLKVTANLSLAALDDWCALRRPNGITVTRSFQQWLDNVASDQRGRQPGTATDAFQ